MILLPDPGKNAILRDGLVMLGLVPPVVLHRRLWLLRRHQPVLVVLVDCVLVWLLAFGRELVERAHDRFFSAFLTRIIRGQGQTLA